MGVGALGVWVTGVLSNQEENSINFYFIMVPLKKSSRVWYSKAQVMGDLAFGSPGF